MNDYEPEVNPLVSPVFGKSMVNLPIRDDASSSGSKVGSITLSLSGQDRDNVIMKEVLSGNVPDSVRNFAPITLMSSGNTLQYYVSGDVLAVGSNENYLRVSLNGKSAKKICDAIGCMLPTKKMADDIWRSSDLKVNPIGLGGTPSMTNTQTLILSNNAINNQIGTQSFTLLSGHKKDIVLSKTLLSHPDRLSIYGWFYKNGIAIQGPEPQSSRHDIWYQDYSHGIRLVRRNALLNDKPVDLYDVLADPKYAYLLSEEGPYNASFIYT